MKLTTTLFIIFLMQLSYGANAQQAYLHAEGKNIVNGNGKNVLLRGIGLGGWMLQEGYMLQTEGYANTQHEIEELIEELIGKEAKVKFYKDWLKNYIRKRDVDSLATWGFNSIRLPLHYKLFTLPIEEESVWGRDTWIDTGFELIDELLEWCEENEVYLILDLHAAPGGQGKDAAISDYDSSKLSLWESAENQRKLIALWEKLAERYANEPWIGGYDLINETNWELSGNAMLKNLYLKCTNVIRKHDQNHIIFIEGNWFANDFTGLTPPWDNNMVYSFHKYWTFNNQNSIQWMLDIRDKYNIPLWLGESGENSNTWFTNALQLFEKNNIGWAWWPYKKIGSQSGIITIPKTDGYKKILDYWEGKASKPSISVAEDWLISQVEMLKLENCEINYDVIDAMIRQAQGDKTSKAFSENNIPGTIYASNYDLGSNGNAYFDNDTADYHLSTDVYSAWNLGWEYRNDGVDIETCTDANSNGYNIGWTEKGEWLNYTVHVDEEAAYTFDLRYASEPSTGQFHLELDNVNVTNNKYIPGTGSWNNWKIYSVQNVVLKKGKHQLKFAINNSGFNINYFSFTNPVSLNTVNPDIIHLKTDEGGKFIKIMSNLGYSKGLPKLNDFKLEKNGQEIEIETIEIDSLNSNVLLLQTASDFISSDKIYLSYTNNSLKSPFNDSYPVFSKKIVENTAPDFIALPAKIEAEYFFFNNGFELENCSDSGAGKNLAYANPGDYVDYQVNIKNEGEYKISYRVASANPGKFEMRIITDETEEKLHQVTVSTGGWQSWQTIAEYAELPPGKFILRIYALSGEFNLNWFEVSKATVAKQLLKQANNFVIIHQNNSTLKLYNKSETLNSIDVSCYDLHGRKIFTERINFQGNNTIQLANRLSYKGIYIFHMLSSEVNQMQKLLVH